MLCGLYIVLEIRVLLVPTMSCLCVVCCMVVVLWLFFVQPPRAGDATVERYISVDPLPMLQRCLKKSPVRSPGEDVQVKWV